jgi:TPR repeat protein
VLVLNEPSREAARNWTQAAGFYRDAAAAGVAESQYALGLCYSFGNGEATTCWGKAAVQGSMAGGLHNTNLSVLQVT